MKEEIQRGIKEHFELNENKSRASRNPKDITEVMK
jgi:hypothetical protein